MQTHVLSSDPSASRLTAAGAEPVGRLPASRQIFIVLGAAIGLGGGFAPVYFATLSIFLKPVAGEFAWGRAETAAAGVLSMLGLALGAVLVGRAIDRFGPARVICSSVALMAGLIALLSQVTNNPWIFAALSFLIGVAGAATTPPGYLSVLALWFDRRLGLALGLAGVGMGVGTVSMPVIAQWLIAQAGWRGAYTALALMAAILGALACAMLFVSANRSADTGRTRPSEAPEVAGETLSEGIRTWRFWLLAGVVFAVSAASLGMSIHLVSLITDQGIDAAAAARIAAVSGVGVILGRLVSGALLDVCAAPRLAAVAFSMAGAGVAVLATGTAAGFVPLAACAMLIGFAIGAEGDFIPFFVRRYFGLRAFASLYGLLFFAFGVGGLVGPIAFGICFDRTHSYATAMWAAAIVLLACAAAILGLGPYRHASDRAVHPLGPQP